MKRLSLLLVLGLAFLLFWVWYRRPAGRSFASSVSAMPRGLRTFDSCNLDAPAAVRDAFYRGVQAQLDGDDEAARIAYRTVLSYIPGEPTTRYNLRLM